MQQEISRWKWLSLPTVAVATALSLTLLVQVGRLSDQPEAQTGGSGPSKTQGSGSSSPASTPSPTPTTGQEKPSTPPLPDRRVSRGQLLARTAMAYRGVRYRWGGRSEKTGFDCSGLVQAVCAKWGLYLPRIARAQFKVGVSVKPEELQPGDLVFFKNTYRRGLSHVGIYIGEGCFVHAPGHGKHVTISRLDSVYRHKHWAGARRLDLSKLPSVPGEEGPVENVTVEESTPETPDP